LVLAACSQPAPEPVDTSEADAAAIRAHTDQFLALWNAADVAGLGAMYDDDAIRMQPDGPNAEGREAILQAFTEYFDEFDAQQTAVVDEVGVFGGVGFGRGTWSVRQTPKAGGDEQERNGKWFVMHRRQADGSWKTWRWMWNEEGTTQ
jgi:ketosteroid isomerase-like protein